MRFKIKQYQGRLKKSFKERYQIWRRKHSKWWDRFLEKGHEKMTVMFIPHNEKRIFNFQISKFFIAFFVLLFFIILASSSYAIIKNAAIKREEERLLLNYRDIRSHLIRFERQTNKMADLFDEIKPYIEDLYALSAGSDDSVERIWDFDESADPDINELRKLRSILPDEIFTLRQLQREFICTTNAVKAVKNFIDVRSKVINDTPSIVPNAGNITSLFGWRRSPFGFGRDFHTGIDIAAAGGTAIRATAPGVVEATGWAGGYGYMVRIRHKYGFETVYAHCSAIYVSKGQTISRGQVIAAVGQTGNATGNHCHYEVRLGNTPINPYPYMRKIW